VTIWLFLWILLSLGLLGFTVWTLMILLQQKKTWRQFAKKNKLRYRNTAFMNSPQVNGMYKGYAVGIFTSEHETERGGTSRKLTAIEVEMDSRMPIEGAIGSGGMVRVVQSLGYSDEFKPDYDFWNTEYIARCQDRRVLDKFLDKDRAKALVNLMERKNTWVIFIFKGADTVLRIDTPSPFENLEKLTQTIDDMVEIARLLELRKGESGNLTSLKMRKEAVAVHVDMDDDEMAFIGLELEDDNGVIPPDVEVEEESAAMPDEPAAAPVKPEPIKKKETAAKKPEAKKKTAAKKKPSAKTAKPKPKTTK